MRPVNIYRLSRVHEEIDFNRIERHESQKSDRRHIHIHEIESLRLFVDALINRCTLISELEGFHYGFSIPQIGKEFDLLKISEKSCLNIELKSQEVSEEQILEQLLRNRHYLMHLGKRITLYSVVTNKLKCYKLSLNDDLVESSIDEIAASVKKDSSNYFENIEVLFRASDYLVSPLNSPDKFIQGEYFLTQAQEQIKKEILKGIDNAFLGAFFHISGKPGTGKTLLLYDIAKTLSKNGKTLIIHCGKLSDGQRKIDHDIDNLDIVSAVSLRSDDFDLSKYSFVLVDESHRIYTQQFDKIVSSVVDNDQVCIFSSDPGQILSSSERRNDIEGKISQLRLDGEYSLSEKIRMNKELHSFISVIKDLKHKPKIPMNYENVSVNYANTTQEAQNMLEYYRQNGYVFINYSKSNYESSPYAAYEEDFDTHHVIGQEFDKVVMLMDNSFYYDEEGVLKGIPHPNPDYLYPNLFYQGVTRVREKLSLIVVDAPKLFEKITSIFEECEGK